MKCIRHHVAADQIVRGLRVVSPLLHRNFPFQFQHFPVNMYRSGSSTRVSDEFFSNSLSSAPASDAEEQQLPTFNPASHVAKKEKIRLRSAETAVHIIPLLLIFCAVILWFFSSPGTLLPLDFYHRSGLMRMLEFSIIFFLSSMADSGISVLWIINSQLESLVLVFV